MLQYPQPAVNLGKAIVDQFQILRKYFIGVIHNAENYTVLDGSAGLDACGGN